MKRFFLSMLTAVMAIAFVGCEYDDSELTGRVENLEGRVQTLEQLCNQMNTNISSLQSLVNALQQNDYITSVTPITEGGKTIGYTITFAKGEPITIYHGQDGKDGANGADGKDGVDGEDGYTPVIGVAQDEDGEYYWTLDGEWLTDKEGNKIPTSGKDGADGEDGTTEKGGMPELKIQGGYWYVSYDGGETWERLGRATGYDGSDGDAFFKGVDYSNPDYVIFTLLNGKTFTVPKYNFAVEFVNVPESPEIVAGGDALILSYSISGCQNPTISVSASGDLNAVINKDSKTIKITALSSGTYNITEQVTLLVSNGSATVMDVVDIYVSYKEDISSVAELDDFLSRATAGEFYFTSYLNYSGETINGDETAIDIPEGGNFTFYGKVDGTDVTAGDANDYGIIARENSTLVLNDVDLVSQGGGIGATGGANVEVNGGSVYVDSTNTSGRYNIYAVGNGTIVTVNGGTYSFNPKKNDKRCYIYVGSGATVYVNGGTFGKASTRSGYTAGILGDGSVIIKGGTFGFDPSAWVAEGYEATKSGETWTVAAK